MFFQRKKIKIKLTEKKVNPISLWKVLVTSVKKIYPIRIKIIELIKIKFFFINYDLSLTTKGLTIQLINAIDKNGIGIANKG